MSSIPLFGYALMLHGLLDVLVNHELLAKLPQRREAAEEEALHVAREAIVACLFAALAWHAWQGDWAWWIAALLLGEVLVSARDVVVEGNVRVLPLAELGADNAGAGRGRRVPARRHRRPAQAPGSARLSGRPPLLSTS